VVNLIKKKFKNVLRGRLSFAAVWDNVDLDTLLWLAIEDKTAGINKLLVKRLNEILCNV